MYGALALKSKPLGGSISQPELYLALVVHPFIGAQRSHFSRLFKPPQPLCLGCKILNSERTYCGYWIETEAEVQKYSRDMFRVWPVM